MICLVSLSTLISCAYLGFSKAQCNQNQCWDFLQFAALDVYSDQLLHYTYHKKNKIR